MGHSLSQNYVHLIFHIKTTSSIIRTEDKIRLYNYLAELLLQRSCAPIMIGGVENHVHILFSLSKNHALSDVVEYTKKNSSLWLRQQNDFYYNFAWQRGYACFSVSASALNDVKEYIGNQEEHHKTIVYQDEVKQLLKAYNLPYNDFSFAD